MARKSSTLKSPVTFSLGTVLLFVLVFGAVGAYAVWKSLAAPRSNASISIVYPAGKTNLNYGDTFYASYTDKSPYDWGYAECRPNSTTQLSQPNTGVIWGEWRATQSNGTIGAFNLIDPNNKEWTGGGADCILKLINTKKSYTNALAQVSFTVNP
jgi:hypothetical protein